MSLTSIKIGPRVLAVVALLSIASAAIGLMGVLSLDRYQRQTAVMESVAKQTQFGERLNALVYAVVMDSRGVYMSADTAAAKPFADGMLRFLQQIEDLVKEWSGLVGPEQANSEEGRQFIATVNQFVQFRRELARLGAEVDPKKGREFGDNDANRSNRQALNRQIEAITKRNAERIIEVSNDLNNYYQTQRPLLIVTTIVAIAISVLLALYIVVVTLTRPISRITGVMNTLAQGDVSVDVTGKERGDEIGEMAKAVQVFKDNMVARSEAEAQIARQREEAEQRRQEREARERAAGEEIASLVNKVAQGDLSGRISESGKEGFFLSTSQELNRLTATLQTMAGELAEVMEALANGDLTKSVKGDYHGVFGQLKDSANTMAGRLRDFATRLSAATRSVKNAAQEITTGSQDLAQRTESQAASIEETAASMHEITTTVKQNADNAQAANQLATAARDTAEKGGSVVGDAVSAVNRIEESAQKISDIVGLIDEIAFQTNLLALNASVEAARAGEAGKGFAVVAQEVRALAQRSANASKDIKALITESNQQVKTGAGLVNQTGSSLTDIVASIKKVSDIVAEIAAASREQATGLEQINTAVGSMDEMTQRNAALVEETTAAAASLNDQANTLSELAAFFKTGANALEATESRVVPMMRPAVSQPAKESAAKEQPKEAAPKLAPALKAVPKPEPKPTPKPAPVMVAADDDDWQEF
ncbi:methyl-accepting chemotaxis protein [uncultured Ferrovibrio sp.]|jgi:methyl-accepting chemotaxis protein|uniref:methyl-accepting chemotaxis protein n=1 Tax=uncultured Ferrovibrio sp. TaxID=1576913 RepID=UPI0026284FE7|nr:methyl-accepting chemotaxis protein [uncultured Ferrovibrio sp.]